MAVPIPQSDQGYFDIYIDNMIGVTPDLHNYPLHMCRAIPLAICTLARPLDINDIIPRKDIISTKKKSGGRALGRAKDSPWVDIRHKIVKDITPSLQT